jgi:hypothetical protein
MAGPIALSLAKPAPVSLRMCRRRYAFFRAVMSVTVPMKQVARSRCCTIPREQFSPLTRPDLLHLLERLIN